MKVLLVINEKSGAVKDLGVDAIRAHGRAARDVVKDLEIEIVHGEAEALIEAARQADAFDVVAAAGGDGTQAAIAGALKGSQTALLPLPCGTMNMLCRDLGMPHDIEEALRVGLTGERAQVDVGVVGDRTFLNNIVFGAYAEIAEAREELRDAKTLDDVSFGLVGAAQALFHADPLQFSVTLDGEAETLRTNTIMVSNNAISGAENMVPHREALNAGKLAVYLTDARHGGDFAALIADFASGGADEAAGVSLRCVARCVIDADADRFAYSIDGDPMETDGAVEMRIEPSALTVMRAARL